MRVLKSTLRIFKLNSSNRLTKNLQINNRMSHKKSLNPNQLRLKKRLSNKSKL